MERKNDFIEKSKYNIRMLWSVPGEPQGIHSSSKDFHKKRGEHTARPPFDLN